MILMINKLLYQIDTIDQFCQTDITSYNALYDPFCRTHRLDTNTSMLLFFHAKPIFPGTVFILDNRPIYCFEYF